MDMQASVKWNDLCRGSVGFIRAQNHGLAGYVFTDFGDSFTVTDMTGEVPVERIIDSIDTSKPGEIVVELLKLPEGEKHQLEESAHEGWVEFEEVPEPLGSLLNNQGAFQIKHVTRVNTLGEAQFDPFALSVLVPQLQNIPQHTEAGGRIRQVKQPVTMQFRSLRENILQPLSDTSESLWFTDAAKFGRADQLHVAFAALWQYEREHGEIPPARNDEAVEEVVSIAKRYNSAGKNSEESFSVEELDEDVIRTTARFASCTFQPLSSFLGGVVAQEAIKYTGEFTPMHQWLHVDCFEVLPDRFVHQSGPEETAEEESSGEFSPVGSRYDDLIRILGRPLHRSLMKQKALVVGSGALGSEILKNCALLGVAADPEGQGLMTVVEDSEVKLSDLSTQLLFRESDLNKHKSDLVVDRIRRINEDINARAVHVVAERSSEAETRLGETLWSSLDVVFCTKERKQAHDYVDSRCVFYEKPLLDGDTAGSKGNLQVILPHRTCSYTDRPDEDKNVLPMPKSIRVFPRTLEDCVTWAKHEFIYLFSDDAEKAGRFLESPQDFLQELRRKTLEGERANVADRVTMEMESMQKVHELLLHRHTQPIDFSACVEKVFNRFHRQHKDMIELLIEDFPEDYTLRDGSRFWSGTKRFPQVLEFNVDNPVHMDYVITAANLLAVNFGLVQVDAPPPTEWLDRQFVGRIVDGLAVPERQVMGVRATEEELSSKAKQEETIARFEGLLDDLETLSKDETKLKSVRVEPVTFLSKHSMDLHMRFITAASNLRAANYRMKEIPRHTAKSIATDICPTLVTAAAVTAGLACIELLKVVQPRKTIEAFKDGSHSASINGYFFMEPTPPEKVQDGYDVIQLRELKTQPQGFTKWDKTVIEGDGTLGEFLQRFKAKTDLNCTCLWVDSPANAICGPQGMIFDAEPLKAKHVEEYQQRLEIRLVDIIANIYGEEVIASRTYIGLECEAVDDEDNGYSVPQLVYKFA